MKNKISHGSLISFNPNEFHEYEYTSIYDDKVILRAIFYGYIGLINYSFCLN